MKTYNEIKSSLTFPDMIDEALQETISEWFGYREVCDDTKFPTFFMRTLVNDYDRYMQLLRIEAGVSQYDWLVSKYRERQHYLTGTREAEVDTDMGVQTTDAHTGTDTTTRTLTKEGTVTDEMEHGKVATHSGAHTITDGRTVTNATKTTTDTRRKQTSGGWSDTSTDGRQITDTRDIQTIGGDDSTVETRGWTTKDDKSLAKVAPMSISYANGVAEPTAPSGASASGGNSGGTLDWTSATQQSADFGRDDTGEVTTQHQGHIQDKSVRGTTGTLQDIRSYSDLTEQHSGGLSETESRTETRSYSDIDTTAVTNSGTDTGTKEFDTTDTETIETTGNRGNFRSVTTAGGVYHLTNSDELQQEVYTGRDESPAELLKKAVQFITRTDAWDWLYGQLDPCFMAIYD